MTSLTFDTLRYAERLEKAGASRELASAIAEAQKDALSEALETQLATKADLLEVKNDLLEVKNELKLDISGLRGEMATIKWMMGVLIAIAIANFAKQFF